MIISMSIKPQTHLNSVQELHVGIATMQDNIRVFVIERYILFAPTYIIDQVLDRQGSIGSDLALMDFSNHSSHVELEQD